MRDRNDNIELTTADIEEEVILQGEAHPTALEAAPRWTADRGKIGWALLWLLGVPLPVLLVIYLIRGH